MKERLNYMMRYKQSLKNQIDSLHPIYLAADGIVGNNLFLTLEQAFDTNRQILLGILEIYYEKRYRKRSNE